MMDPWASATLRPLLLRFAFAGLLAFVLVSPADAASEKRQCLKSCKTLQKN
jgi:hypothetical protein